MCQRMFESRISAAATEKLPGLENPHAKTVCSKMRWEILRIGEQKGRAVIQSFQVLAWMITISRMSNLNQLENCQKYAHKLS